MDTKECAKDAGRHVETIRRWIRQGRLTAHKDGFGAEYDVDPNEWKEFCERYRIKRKGGAD
jgi:excisionase family DNA binding protein